MKWYVFAESECFKYLMTLTISRLLIFVPIYIVDTYIVWSSMLQYLSALDPTQELYTGMYMWAGADLFAYGGSGFVVSRAATQTVATYYSLHKEELEDFFDHNWAGDCALGKAMRDAGVPFPNAWPVMQGDYPGWLTYDAAEGRSMADAIARFWCTPVATSHHVSPDAVHDVWVVEQECIAKNRNVSYSAGLIRKIGRLIP